VKFCVEVDHKHTYKFCMNFFYYFVTITYVAVVQNFEVIVDKFNIFGIFTSENNAQTGSLTCSDYCGVVLVNFTKIT
jgi:hypothetical protein